MLITDNIESFVELREFRDHFSHICTSEFELIKSLQKIESYNLEHEKIITVTVFGNILSSPSSVYVYTYAVAVVLVVVAVLVVGVVVVILVVYYFGKTLIIPLSSIKHLIVGTYNVKHVGK